MADSSNVATSFGVLNYSGLIFNTSDVATPLLNMLPRSTTNHVEFVIETRYALGSASQPQISEIASLTAPEPNFITRGQTTNVTQIFMKSTAISYAKMSNMGTMSGINIENQQGNVQNELDWQVSAKTQEMRNDIEYTIINGRYNKATNDNEANQTRGLIECVKTNVIDLANAKLTTKDIADMMQMIWSVFAPTDGLVMMVPAAVRRLITEIYPQESGFLLPASRNVGGVSIDQIVTDFGTIGLMIHNRMPENTILFANFSVTGLKEQPVPGKGNFFWEELSRTGAGITGELFGQIGLDHGPEWYHGIIKNIGGTSTYQIKNVVPNIGNTSTADGTASEVSNSHIQGDLATTQEPIRSSSKNR